MKAAVVKVQPKYKGTFTYHAIVQLDYFDGYLFNHGTESDIINFIDLLED